MIRTVVAVERDGLDSRILTLLFEVPGDDFNLEYWVRKAATDYCLTKIGRETYDYNCNYFNWADFASSVPNEFCRKYGFEKIDSCLSDIIVDWDEHLVDDSQIEDDGD